MYICTDYIEMRMKKKILLIPVLLAMLLVAPACLNAAGVAMPGIEQMNDDEVSITVQGQTVTVNGGQGMTLEVVSLTGRRIKTVKIEIPAQKVELNIPKGCYILKIGKVVRKISVL